LGFDLGGLCLGVERSDFRVGLSTFSLRNKAEGRTRRYYLHLFSAQQPDLNFANPELMEAVKQMMRFWLDKGINGFRLDAINFISKVRRSVQADLSHLLTACSSQRTSQTHQ
jgi:glycosidase